ncbi:MAG: hypothetical protein ABL949_06050 [Fimbriimonadaceae bacterium]
MAIPPTAIKAFHCMPILIEAAKKGTLINYDELAAKINHPQFHMGGVLAYVRDMICDQHRMPQLTSLIVIKGTDLPGESFFPEGRGELSDEDYRAICRPIQQACFDFERWDAVWTNLKQHYQLGKEFK